ncbi:Uncharacterized protein dnm_083330 [Desulfonema magnum]|uniref:Uncharacterized protein n=1 Tax=Desulfonema magnum TaxID=45655 RepID=A0A975BVQ8_9BACT|nr:Uncharacterized protein dnm_083330 [Desulfonema magnum]
MLKLLCHGYHSGENRSDVRLAMPRRLFVSLCLRVFVALSFRLKKIAHGPAFENITIFRNGGGIP